MGSYESNRIYKKGDEGIIGIIDDWVGIPYWAPIALIFRNKLIK